MKNTQLKTNVSRKLLSLFLSNKVQSSERIKLAEEDTLITHEEEVAMKLNDFFSNAVINLKIPRLENFDLLLENIGNHPNLKDNVKCGKYPSIIAIASKFVKGCFSFNTIIIEDMLKEISM